MSRRPERPLLDVTKYDTIVIGTGLTESIISSSLARIGQKVLVLDPNEHYGSQYTTPNLLDFKSTYLQDSGEKKEEQIDHAIEKLKNEKKNYFKSFRPVELIHERGTLPERSRFFYFDMHTKFLYSHADMVKLLIDSGVGGRYLEFRCLNGVLLFLDGKFEQVPCSKGEIFSTKLLSLKEKRFLMKFVKSVRGLAEMDSKDEEFLEVCKEFPTFIDYLNCKKFRLTEKLQNMLKYAVVMLESDSASITLQKGVERMKIYMQSLGRFGNTGFLYPIYGISELPQSFCRACAVYGGTFVLGREVREILFREDEEGRPKVRAVRCSRGQELECDHLVMNRQFTFHEALGAKQKEAVEEEEEGEIVPKEKKKASYQTIMLRKIVITNFYILHPGMFKESYHSKESVFYNYGAIMGIFPPRTFPGQRYVIKFTQMDCSSKVCPKGFYVMSWETRVDVEDEAKGIEFLEECVKTTLDIQKVSIEDFRKEPEPEEEEKEKEGETKEEKTETNDGEKVEVETKKEEEEKEKEVKKKEEPEEEKKELIYEVFFKYKLMEESGLSESLRGIPNLDFCSDVSYEYTVDNSVEESRRIFEKVMEKEEDEEKKVFMKPLPSQEPRLDRSAELLGVDQEEIKKEIEKEKKEKEGEETKGEGDEQEVKETQEKTEEKEVKAEEKGD